MYCNILECVITIYKHIRHFLTKHYFCSGIMNYLWHYLWHDHSGDDGGRERERSMDQSWWAGWLRQVWVVTFPDHRCQFSEEREPSSLNIQGPATLEFIQLFTERAELRLKTRPEWEGSAWWYYRRPDRWPPGGRCRGDFSSSWWSRCRPQPCPAWQRGPAVVSVQGSE